MEKKEIMSPLVEIKCLYKYYKHLKTYYFKKWFITPEPETKEVKDYIDISQSSYSLSLLWENLFFPNPTIHFFLELVNTFQKLESKETKNIPYNSYSQAFTTYCLKRLAQQNIIEIIEIEKDSTKSSLEEYEQMFESERSSREVSMYNVQFFKIRNLTKKDIPFLQKVAVSLKVDFNCYHIKERNKKIRLTLKSEKIITAIITGETYRKAISQKNVLSYIMEEIKEEFQDIRKEQYNSVELTLTPDKNIKTNKS